MPCPNCVCKDCDHFFRRPDKPITLVCSRHTYFNGICDECVAANFNRNRGAAT